jgi:hypothetical protein
MKDGFFYGRIETYEIQVYSDTPEDLVSDAVIYLRLEDATYSRAELWFVRKGVPLPDNQVVTSGTSGAGTFQVYFRLEKLPFIVDTLRHEGPVWFWWEASRVAAIRTGREPTGEVTRDTQ